MRLIVRCDSHSVAPGFFGKAIKMDFDKSEGISPLSYMAFRKSVNISFPNSSRPSIISTVILSGHFFIDLTAFLTSSFIIGGPPKFFIIGGLSPLSSW